MNHLNSLWSAVILQAVADYVLFKGSTDPNSRRIFYNAEHWLFHDRSGRFNSLEVLCECLGIDPGPLRRALQAMTGDELRSLKLRQSRRNYGSASPPLRSGYSSSERRALSEADEEDVDWATEHGDEVPRAAEVLLARTPSPS